MRPNDGLHNHSVETSALGRRKSVGIRKKSTRFTIIVSSMRRSFRTFRRNHRSSSSCVHQHARCSI